MSGLLNKLQEEGSVYSSYDGTTPTPYNQVGVLNPTSFSGSQLDLNGATPTPYNQIGILNPQSLINSQLDLDGLTPPKYLDNPPE